MSETVVFRELQGCTTAAHLIDSLIWLHNHRPPPAREGDEDGQKAVSDYIYKEQLFQEQLRTCVAYHGPVLWRGQIWYDRMPPRLRVVNHTPFGGFANDLPWPPKLPEKAPHPPEKAAGFISQQHW